MRISVFSLSKAMSAVLLCAQAFHAQASQRPNILWITCEDMSPNLGCFGDSFAATPVLDRLARQGIRYTNAYAVTGVCAPNRSCLITGVYPSTLGSHNMRCTTRLPSFIKCFTEYLRRAGYWCSNNVKTDYNFPTPASAWDQCSRKAHWRNRKPGQNFFSVFNFTVTHESQIRLPEKRFLRRTARLTSSQRHDPRKVPLPPFHPATPEVRQDWARYYDLITAMDYKVGDLLGQLQQDGLVDSTIVFFFSDHGVGMPGCKKWVWEPGLHVPLIVRFPQAFRSWAPAPPGGVCSQMVSFVDFAPTVLSLAGVPIPPHMQGRALLGTQKREPRRFAFIIRDRMAERYDIVRGVREGALHYLRNYMPHLSWSQYVSYTEQMPTMKVWRRCAQKGALTAAQARYFSPTKPREELYNTEKDPYHLHNLAGRKEYARALLRLRARTRTFQIQTHDLGLLPEYEIEKRSHSSTPYEMGRNPALNPVERLIEAAGWANRMEAGHIPRLVKLLNDGDSAVRFWGAVGLNALGQKANPAEKSLREALSDPSPVVRVEVAEALCRTGRRDLGIPVLTEALRHETPFVRLRALNALDRLKDLPPSAVQAIRSGSLSSKAHPHVAQYVNRMVGYVPKKR